MPQASIVFLRTATRSTEIYTLSLHDALPISASDSESILATVLAGAAGVAGGGTTGLAVTAARSEEHTSELQSRRDLVCRLLLEKKKRPAYEKTESLPKT